MTACFITGGDGFVGRVLVARLLARHPDAQLTCLAAPAASDVRVASGHRADGAAYWAGLRARGVRVVEGDLTACPAFPVTDLDAPQVIFHLAANNLKASGEARLMAINRDGTRNLLETWGEQVRGARVIYTSTLDVLEPRTYPQQPPGEAAVPQPVSAYGHSKWAAETAIRAGVNAQGYTPVILRLSSVYGAESRAGLIYELWRMVSGGRLLSRFDWPGRCSVVHVDNVVDLLERSAFGPALRHDLYHVAEPGSVAVGALLRWLGNAGGGGQVTPLPVPRALGRLVWLPGLRQWVPAALKSVLSDSFVADATRVQAEFDGTWRRVQEEIPALVNAFAE